MIRTARAPRPRRLLAGLMATGLALFGVLAAAQPASAYEPVGIVHTEVVEVGPYEVTVGFSRWPVRAMQSLDFTFIPDGGIADKQGTLTISGAETTENAEEGVLARHPRKLEVWGLDVFALDTAGSYSIEFEIDGPAGRGTGTLDDLEVLAQPGPPLALSWALASAPFLGLVALIAVGWWRARPASAARAEIG